MSTTTYPLGLLDFLSELIDRQVKEEQANDLLIFVAALSAVGMGVIAVDGEVTIQEKHLLGHTLQRFIASGDPLIALAREIFNGIKKYKIYSNTNELSKLTGILDEPEKLLLIALGYEMAIADGLLDPTEEQYLRNLARQCDLEDHLIDSLQNGLLGEPYGDRHVNKQLQFLLDPAQFKDLDPVFSQVAEEILAKLPGEKARIASGHDEALNYSTLEEFHDKRLQLMEICSDLCVLLSKCESQVVISRKLNEDTKIVKKHLLDKRFRIAVVGEFSQGKSTLLNAMLGEEIQPVRAIPCSGAISVLKYGEQKRVTCRYKNGQEVDIPLDQYQEVTTISDNAAMNGVSDELERSEIDEVIFEHPGLEICRQGVEIIDSPGLNEHPDRTRITHKLVDQADAVIFLANAYRPFTQTEKELLQGLKVKLAGEQPANNLFVVMNFMDLLRRESDRQQVRQLAENFVSGKIPLVSNQNRLHFISAQESLEAILNGKENEYLENFRAFTQELEGFLTHESGNQLIQKARRQLDNIGNSLEVSLDAARNNLDSQVNFSYAERQEVLEKIGEITGRSQKLKILLEEKRDDTMVTIESQWPSRWEALKQTITQKSDTWKILGDDIGQLTQGFSDQLLNDVSIELETMTKHLHEDLIQPVLESVMTSLQEEIQAIQKILTHLDLKLNSQLNRQYELSISRLNNKLSFDFPNSVELENNARNKFRLMASGVVAGTVLAVAMTGALALIPFIPMGGIYRKLKGSFYIRESSKNRGKILETGLKQLDSQQNKIHSQVIEEIGSKFYQLSTEIESEFLSVITLLNDVLSKREQALRKSDEIRQQEMAYLEAFQERLESLTQQI